MNDSATQQHMIDPQVGDRFQEMLSHWVWVISRAASTVTVICGPSARGPWETITFPTVKAFRHYYAYKGIPGYWVMYHDTCPIPEQITAK